LVAPIVADLGHEIGAREIEIEDDERCNSAKRRPDVFLAS
jgi:hypothetical protein